jgi:hypothetical protein
MDETSQPNANKRQGLVPKFRNINLGLHPGARQAFSQKSFWREPRTPHVGGFAGRSPRSAGISSFHAQPEAPAKPARRRLPQTQRAGAAGWA